MGTEIRVDPAALHSAGAAASGHADSVRGAAGSAGATFGDLAGAAAHPDAAEAFGRYADVVTNGLASLAGVIDDYAAQLHAAADGYGAADASAAGGVSHAG